MRGIYDQHSVAKYHTGQRGEQTKTIFNSTSLRSLLLCSTSNLLGRLVKIVHRPCSFLRCCNPATNGWPLGHSFPKKKKVELLQHYPATKRSHGKLVNPFLYNSTWVNQACGYAACHRNMKAVYCCPSPCYTVWEWSSLGQLYLGKPATKRHQPHWNYQVTPDESPNISFPKLNATRHAFPKNFSQANFCKLDH